MHFAHGTHDTYCLVVEVSNLVACFSMPSPRGVFPEEGRYLCSWPSCRSHLWQLDKGSVLEKQSAISCLTVQGREPGIRVHEEGKFCTSSTGEALEPKLTHFCHQSPCFAAHSTSKPLACHPRCPLQFPWGLLRPLGILLRGRTVLPSRSREEQQLSRSLTFEACKVTRGGESQHR